jgi:ECF sigma factor.
LYEFSEALRLRSKIGEVLQLSPATVERDWSFARAWLYDALQHS